MSIFSAAEQQLLHKLFSITSNFKIYARKPEKSKTLYADDYLQAFSNYGIDLKLYDTICYKPIRNGMIFMIDSQDLYKRLLSIGVIRVKNIIVELLEEKKFYSCCKVLFKGINPLWTDENIKDFLSIFKTPYSSYRNISSNSIKSKSDKLLVGFNYAPKVLIDLTPKGKKIIIDNNTMVKFQWMIICTCSRCNCIGHNVHLCPFNSKFSDKTTNVNRAIPTTHNLSNAVEFLKKSWPIDIIIPKVADIDGDSVVEDNLDGQSSVDESFSYSDGDSDFSTGSMDSNLDFDAFKFNTYKKRRKK